MCTLHGPTLSVPQGNYISLQSPSLLCPSTQISLDTFELCEEKLSLLFESGRKLATMFGSNKETQAIEPQADSGSDEQYVQNVDPLADIPKNRWQRLWPVMACGAGLFSDGYINNVSDSTVSIKPANH